MILNKKSEKNFRFLLTNAKSCGIIYSRKEKDGRSTK
nr:MAG TPA: hypothetical protein [Caudoviricetes sp.]